MSNVVLLQDCMESLSAERDRSIPLVLTDIPYNAVNRASNGLRGLDKGFADGPPFNHIGFALEVSRVAQSCYIFCATEQVSDIRRSLIEGGMTTRVGVWHKSNPSPMNGQHVWLSGVELCVYGKHRGATFNRHCENTIWKYPIQRKRNHPTPKPVALLQYLIESSTNPGDLVVDPCVGGGSTAVAAYFSGREFRVSDSNPDCIRWTHEWLYEVKGKTHA